MENKARYTLVGLFVLIFTIAMVTFILWLARYDAKEILAKEYRVYSKNSIAGLNENSIVEYKGLDIGTVDKIQINPKNLEEIEIILKITTPEVIKTDSYVLIQSQGVTGNKLIEIDGGTKESKNLLPKDGSFAVLPVKESFLDKLTTSASNISSQVESILTKFEKILNEKNINNIDQLLSNANNSSKNLEEVMLKINHVLDKSLIKTLNNIDNAANSIENSFNGEIKDTVKTVDVLAKDINLLSSDIRKLVNSDIKAILEDFKETAKSSQDIDLVLNQLENTLEKIDLTVEEFNQNGGNMIFNTRQTTYGPGEKQWKKSNL